MAPIVTKQTYGARPLFDPPRGSLHIKDIVQMDSKYLLRTSDLVTGMLYLGSKLNAIQKTQACYFKITFLPHLKLRTSVYKHEGRAFTGPDGLAMIIDGVVFGGFENLQAGAYTLDNVHEAPNYLKWIVEILYRGGDKADSDYALRGAVPPKRSIDGTPLTEWKYGSFPTSDNDDRPDNNIHPASGSRPGLGDNSGQTVVGMANIINQGDNGWVGVKEEDQGQDDNAVGKADGEDDAEEQDGDGNVEHGSVQLAVAQEASDDDVITVNIVLRIHRQNGLTVLLNRSQ